MLLENGIHGSRAIRTRGWVYIKHTGVRSSTTCRATPRDEVAAREHEAAVRQRKRSLARDLRALRDCAGERVRASDGTGAAKRLGTRNPRGHPLP